MFQKLTPQAKAVLVTLLHQEMRETRANMRPMDAGGEGDAKWLDQLGDVLDQVYDA